MADKYIATVTFGDVADRSHFHVGYQSCRFCKAHGVPVAAYGLRQNICKPCAEARRDQVLPKVLKRQAWERQMEAARARQPHFIRCNTCHVVNAHKPDCPDADR